ncbi:hypothetical protein JXM67_13235 [candidate division WOR-3 bacterium]|nr:hypothetical protein [candidate division WOR-3 bacterium]
MQWLKIRQSLVLLIWVASLGLSCKPKDIQYGHSEPSDSKLYDLDSVMGPIIYADIYYIMDGELYSADTVDTFIAQYPNIELAVTFLKSPRPEDIKNYPLLFHESFKTTEDDCKEIQFTFWLDEKGLLDTSRCYIYEGTGNREWDSMTLSTISHWRFEGKDSSDDGSSGDGMADIQVFFFLN